MTRLKNVLLLAVAYLVAGCVGHTLAAPAGGVALVWPAAGVALGGLLLGGEALWPGVVLGAFGAALWSWPVLGQSLPGIIAALLAAVGAGLQARAGVQILARMGPDLGSVQGLARFVTAVGITTLLAATIGVAALGWAGFLGPVPTLGIWARWYLGDLLGILAVAPAVTAALEERRRGVDDPRPWTAIAVPTILAIVMALLVYGRGRDQALAGGVLALPLLTWAGLRSGIPALGATLLAWSLAAGIGLFWVGPPAGWPQGLGALQATLVVLALAALGISAFVAQTRQVANELALLREQQRIQQAAAIPQPSDEEIRAQAEQLSRQVAREQAVEFSPDGLILVDSHGRMVFVNREAELIFGYSRDELIGQSLDLLVPMRHRASHRANVERFVADGHHRAMSAGRNLNALRKDGTEFPADIALHSYEHEGERYAVASIRDTTERRHLQAEVETNLLTQQVINQILNASLEPIDLEEHLQRTLEQILSVPWFSRRAMGAIFLKEQGRDELVMKAQKGLPAEIRDHCATVPIGHCLCGQAALHRELVYARSTDARHTVRLLEPPDHAHYCVPIQAEDRLYGVINVFLEGVDHASNDQERIFLTSVASALAGSIERKRSEQALRSSERRFRQLADTMPQMVWTARPGGSVDYFNARWHEYTGMTPEESLSGEGWRGVIHPDDLPAMNASRLPAVGSGEAFQAEVRMRNKHGAYRWHLIRSVPVYDRKGQVLQRYGTATDIDDFKRAQEALRESEERFNLAVQGSDAGIWDWDLRTDVVYFSPRWKSMLGYRDDEVENNFREWETRLHPEDRVRARATIDDYLAGRSTEYQLEHRLRHKDDGYRTILSRGAAVRDSSGKPYRMVGWHIDITAHKETVEELNDKLIQLEAAQRIQQSLLPKRPPSLTGIDLAGLSVPAAYAGGDMFDYLPILGGNLGVVIGDVSGHGIGAALQMAATQAFLRSLSQACTTIPEILTRLNQFVCERLEEEYFLTLLLVRLDPRTRTMLYANAGHPTAYVLDPTGAVREELRSESLPIGVQPQTDFPVGGPIHLQPGEIVVLMTDGILEAEAASTEAFGIERLLRVVREHREQTSQEILDALRAAVEAHTGMKEPRDDLTAVIVKVER